ncbi:MAG: hypothetical protein ACYS1A_07530 [Planctomycetota bacterium]|jgi:hypothetical protein
MTAAQKTASRLRWILLILWILCLLAGIFWLIGYLFDYGLGLLGTPSLALLGPLTELGPLDEDCVYHLLIFFYLAFFFMSQWFFLRPRFLWKVRLQSSGRPLKRSAIAAALATALLSVALLYSVLDLFNVDFFDGLPSTHLIFQLLFLLIPLFLWCFWSVVFCIYLRQSDHYTWVGRIIRGLIAGSVLEMFVAIPVYATRQEECYCARGSYAGLIFGTTVLLWAFGPAVFLLFIREKHRRDKLLDFQENNSPQIADDVKI